MRSGYVVIILICVKTLEIVKLGGNVIQIYEDVIYKEDLKTSSFRKVIEIFFIISLKNKKRVRMLCESL